MAHNIFGQRFLDNRAPAWHGLGHVVTEPLTAREALAHIGEVTVDNVPIPPVDGVEIPYRALIRRATEDDPQDVFFGIVSEAYELIGPSQFAAIFDGALGVPVETIGLLRQGRLMFITTKLPAIDVKGDEVELYLIARNGMDGAHVAGADIAKVRVVCNNTLDLAASSASSSLRVVHTAGAGNQIGAWLHDAYTTAVAQVAAVKESFEVLAETRVTKAHVTKVLEAAYPIRRAPRDTATSEIVAARAERWERDREHTIAWRDGARELFNGRGVGMEHPAAAGTAWGLYNAVCETEDYRKGYTAAAITDENRLFGNRAGSKAAAFNACVTLATGKPGKAKVAAS